MHHTKLKHIIFFLLMTSSVMFSCSKSDPAPKNCSESFVLYAEISDELELWTDAMIAYSQDPSEKNCERYKGAYNDYVNALEKWEGCVREYGDINEWREMLNEARQDIKEMDCN